MTAGLPRPARWVADYARRYPDAWRQVDAMRADPPAPWPAWCFFPLAGAYAIVSGGGENRVHPERIPDVGILGALAAWRVTQGIYRYDPAIYEAVATTPLDDRDLPAHALLRLPEWCVYIEAPGAEVLSLRLAGFFAHLEHDAGTGRAELRLVLDADDPERIGRPLLVPIPLHLAGSLSDAISAMWTETKRQGGAAVPELPAQAMQASAAALAPLVSLVLYLCSEEPDLGGEVPSRPRPIMTKRGPRLFPPPSPRTWDVGARIGAALRAAEAQRDADDTEPREVGERAAVRPHVRRAHWHTYLRGVGRADRYVRWMPPIPVMVEHGAIIPTVRPVH